MHNTLINISVLSIIFQSIVCQQIVKHIFDILLQIPRYFRGYVYESD